MEQLGNYRLLEAVGIGSTGTVWRAVHAELGRTVAVKILNPDADTTLLRAEARILATLDHPNVVAIHDFVEAADSPNGRAWLAEDWIDGERVDELVSRLGERRLSAEQAVGAVRGALLGLAHAHERGVVHGDVSAGNILVDTAGTSRVIDFGLAGPVGSTGGSGTPAFLSPEAARREPTMPASDVYSAAAVLYFLLTGAPVFSGGTADEIVQRHATQTPPALEGHGPHLAGVVRRALSLDPAARPADAGVLLAELEEAAGARFGPGWLARAGLAGLAAAPAGAGAAATLTGGAGAAAVPATAAVVTERADTGLALRRPRGVNHWLIGGVTAGVVAAAAVVVTVVVTSGKDDSVAAAGTPPAATSSTAGQPPAPSVTSTAPTPSRTPVTVQERSALLTGSYAVRIVVTASNDPDEPVGQVAAPAVWRISQGCSGTPCRIAIKAASGDAYNAVFDGRIATIRLHDRTAPQTCIDTITNKPTPGSTVVITTDTVARLRLDTNEPGGLSGTIQKTISYSDYVDCNEKAPYRITYTITATPR